MTDDNKTLTSSPAFADPPSHKTAVGQGATAGKAEPFYQDELDVYEAVAKLEEKYGKKILTDEQREKLKKGGRINSKAENTQNRSERAQRAVDLIMGGVKLSIEDKLKQQFGENSWTNFSNDTKEKLYWDLFNFQFGDSPESLRNFLLIKHGYGEGK